MSDQEYIKRRMELERIAVEDDLDALHPFQYETRRTIRNGKERRTSLRFRTEVERQALIAVDEMAAKGDRFGRINRAPFPA